MVTGATESQFLIHYIKNDKKDVDAIRTWIIEVKDVDAIRTWILRVKFYALPAGSGDLGLVLWA